MKGRTQEEAKQSTPSTGYKNNKPTRQLSSLQHQQDNANQTTSCLADQTTTCLANQSTPVYRRLLLIYLLTFFIYQPSHSLNDNGLDNIDDNSTNLNEDTQTNPDASQAYPDVLNKLTNWPETDNFLDIKSKQNWLYIFSKVFKYNETIGVQQTFQMLDKQFHTQII